MPRKNEPQVQDKLLDLSSLPTQARIDYDLAQRDSTLLITFYFAFKIIPSIVACFSIYLGYKLFIYGVTGQASISVESKSVSGQLLNAAPGLFFAVGGIVVLVIVVWKSVSISAGNGKQGSQLNFKARRS
jgi:hypothetical protein